ncbi:MAG: hypothetical protein JEZ06_14770 [Anaerolineaceae bacterium]|nr:hypothetical protein [Anaerolineaceae bacterium]
MQVPRHWRIKNERYAMMGSICPHCGLKQFPTRAVCPKCRGELIESVQIPQERIEAASIPVFQASVSQDH